MKTTIYTLAVFLAAMMMSCKSVQTLVDSGNYDEAIHLATKKMRGDKVKKTKHVKSLERAFHRVNNSDMEEIEYLRSIGHIDAYERIYDIAERISYRQKLVSPYLPLVSKDGYRGRFEFINDHALLIDAGNKIAELSYATGIDLLNLARSNSKRAHAREAYYSFARCADFNPNYKQVVSLMNEAEALGVDHVVIETIFDSELFFPYEVASYLNEVRYIPQSGKWVRYYRESDAPESVDFLARLVINDISISPEREVRRVFFEEKEVEDGEEYVLDENGNVAKDTLGNDIKKTKFSLVKARIKEIKREKILGIRAMMELVESDNQRSFTRPITAEAVFEDLACIVWGDRRALSGQTRKRVKDYPLDFPSDVDLLLETGDEIKRSFRYELEKMIRRISA